MVDFSFVYEELKDKYSSTMGRTCEDIIRMFKYLLLKSYFKLSDRGLVERTETDLLFKYFLGYDPEETKLINPSLLTVFRRERLKDEENNLMDKLINKTVEIALEKGLIEVVSSIPKSYPGHVLLTEDEGILLGEDDCPCGRKGKYFNVLGRIKNAEIRGCSDTYAAKFK